MRKPRDIDAELKALQDKQKQLRARRVVSVRRTVTATGADALDAETLAGALLEAVERAKADPGAKEAWRRKATASFAANAGPSRTARATLRRELQATAAALRRTTAALRRAEPHAPEPTHEPGCRIAAPAPAASSSSAASCRSPACPRASPLRRPRTNAPSSSARCSWSTGCSPAPTRRSTPPISSRAGAPPAALRCANPIKPTRSQPSDATRPHALDHGKDLIQKLTRRLDDAGRPLA